VERIEVLKGPGSALYGSGSPGGSVNLVSKQPLDIAQYSLSGTYGAFNTYETTADITGPVIQDKLLYRFITHYDNVEGFRNVGHENFEILPTVKLKIAENHDLTFDFDYRDIQSDADTYGIPFQGTSLTQRNSLLDVPRTHKYYTPFGGTRQHVLRYSVMDEYRFTDEILLRNNFVMLDRDLHLIRNGGGSIAAGSQVMTGRSLREQTDKVRDYLYQIETVIDFDTWDLTHKLLMGFEYQYHDINTWRSTASLPNITDVFNPVIPETSKDSLNFVPNFNRDINANYESVYAQDQIDLTEQLKLRLGGRIDRFDTHVDSFLNGVKERREDNPFSGQAGLVYSPVKQTSFYGGLSSSKQAILSTESTAPLNVPESALQYEIGNKTSFFDEKLNFDVSWFHVTRKNFLVTVGADTFPVGEQKTQGVDFDAWLEPIKGWKIIGNYSYQNAHIVDMPVATGPSVAGNRPTGIPGHLVNFWTTYEIQEGPLKGLGVGGGFNYKDSVAINQQNTSIIPSYITMDLVVFYHWKFVEAQVNMKNLTDANWYRNGVNSGALPGDPFGVYGTIRLRYPDPEKGMVP
jgi:iron complex outermembrane recepter protein